MGRCPAALPLLFGLSAGGRSVSGKGVAVFYWFLKWIALGPLLKFVFRPQTEGADHVPDDGAAILASNHLSYADWLFMPLTLTRRVTFVAKAEYFNTPGVKGWFQKQFFSGAGQVPIDRSGASAAEGALSAAKRILDEGDLFGIYPEGTRSHDGKLYRGKTGVARLALETKVPVIPVAVVGTDVVAPPGKKFGTFTRPVVRFGTAARLLPLLRHGERPLHPPLDHRRDHVRDHAALRPGVRRQVRRAGQGGVEEGRGRGQGRRGGRGVRAAEAGVLSVASSGDSPGDTVRAAVAVEDRMFRALAVLRLVTLANAVGLNAYRAGNFDHPVAGLVCVLVMVAWTAAMIWAYADPVRRGVPLLVADLGVVLALMALTPLVKGPDWNATITGFWAIGALMAWAVRLHWVGGLVAGGLLGGTDLLLRAEITQTNYGNVFLLLIGGPIVGFLAASLQQMAVERDRAERRAATAAERARLARVVHDGVLQVLSLVQRRGAELGGDAAELGRLAGEQEVALRTLIRAQDTLHASTPAGLADLAQALGSLGSRPAVTVSTPGTPVELAAYVVGEVVAVVEACLDNVERHVGPQAPAWVLLESFADRVELSVRDEGPGIAPGRLERAVGEGRLGVVQSIRGRVADLGGTATLSTGSFGTEWELVVPRQDPRQGR